MARVADYAIVTDSWVSEGDKDTINFEVPSNIDSGSRCVLGFMLDTAHKSDMKLTIRINGTQVFDWNFGGGNDERVRFFQEVVAAGVVKPGKNEFKFATDGGRIVVVAISDVVIWFQANI